MCGHIINIYYYISKNDISSAEAAPRQAIIFGFRSSARSLGGGKGVQLEGHCQYESKVMRHRVLVAQLKQSATSRL